MVTSQSRAGRLSCCGCRSRAGWLLTVTVCQGGAALIWKNPILAAQRSSLYPPVCREERAVQEMLAAFGAPAVCSKCSQ